MQAQVKTLVDVQRYGEAKNQTGIILYPKVTDQTNFATVVLACYKFEEDIKEIKDALGL